MCTVAPIDRTFISYNITIRFQFSKLHRLYVYVQRLKRCVLDCRVVLSLATSLEKRVIFVDIFYINLILLDIFCFIRLFHSFTVIFDYIR